MSSDTTVYTTYPEADLDERVRYFDGQFLGSQDFVDAQRYHVDRLRRALDHLTVSGVCDGLDVAPAGPWKIKLSPGDAIDGAGRQLVVLAARDGVDVPKDIPGGVVDVALSYAETESRIHGGASDEQGTRGASRLRELPALEFYPAGQSPARVGAVPLARLRITGDGLVTLDDPNPVRRGTGLRLPGRGDAPTLRAGASRPQQLALTGDLHVTGKLGVGTPDPEAELDVRGLVRVGALSLREQPLRVDGDEASFYPVVFRDLDWSAGQCTLELLRPGAHADAANAGSLMARLRWHAGDGHGSELLDVEVVQTRRFLAHARILAKDRLLVVWLRGNRSYAWRANQRVELVDTAAATKTIAGEKLDPRGAVDPAYDRDRLRIGRALEREDLRSNLAVAGDLTYTGKLSHLDTAEVAFATVRATDFTLGHSTRRGSPGRALVDNASALHLNFDGDWPLLVLGSKTKIAGDLTVDKLTTLTGGLAGNLTLHDGNLKLTAGGLTVAKASTFTDNVAVSRDGEMLTLSRPKSTTGGQRTFLELFQDDNTPPTGPETYPNIRFNHKNRYWVRLEARPNSFHLRLGGVDTYADLFAGALTVAEALTVHKSATLNDTLAVARSSTFNDSVRINRDGEHLLLARPKSSTGDLKYFLELQQEDSRQPETPEVGAAIRFHHANRYHHRIEARINGLHIRTGDAGSNDYSDLRAANLLSFDMHVVTGRAERLRMIRGLLSDGGGIDRGSGFSASREDGMTKIVFNPEFADVPVVVCSQQSGGKTTDNAVVCKLNAQAVWIRTGDSDGKQSWRPFHFIAVGL